MAKITNTLMTIIPHIYRFSPNLAKTIGPKVGTDQLVSISIFDSKGKAALADGPMGFWMRRLSAALSDCILGRPAIVSGQTEVYSRVETLASRSVGHQHPPAGGRGALDGDHLMRVSCSSRKRGLHRRRPACAGSDDHVGAASSSRQKHLGLRPRRLFTRQLQDHFIQESDL